MLRFKNPGENIIKGGSNIKNKNRDNTEHYYLVVKKPLVYSNQVEIRIEECRGRIRPEASCYQELVFSKEAREFLREHEDSSALREILQESNKAVYYIKQLP